MPIEVRRFGAGFRRPEGPAGTVGLEGQVIHSDAQGAISEVALARGGRLEPHTNVNAAWFVVIEGGGWTVVGEERRRVAAGEAVLWPAGVVHGAWTEHSEMRAIVVEFAAGVADQLGPGATIDGTARPVAGRPSRAARGEGQLAPRPIDPTRHDRSSGEPL